jgi:DNA-directed RNA polymerase II subunit RPB3
MTLNLSFPNGNPCGADVQDCECDEGCYFCMIQLRLRVSNKHGQKGSPLAVTSDMLEVIPSPNDVSPISSFLFVKHISLCFSTKQTFIFAKSRGRADMQPTQDPYAQLSPDDHQIIQNRFPTLGQPVGKGVEGSTPILLAKLSLDQEIEVVCKAYKVSSLVPSLYSPIPLC